MRKSKYVTFLLAGAAATTLAACEQENAQDAMLYADPAACAKDMDAGVCNESYATAQQEHLQQAPKFATPAECEAAGFAKCEEAQVQKADGSGGHTSFFMPMMMGYMMGRMMSPGGMMPGQTAPRTGTAPPPRPVYTDRSGYMYAGGAGALSRVGQLPSGATSLGSSGTATRVTTRGGFGGSARSFGGGS